MHGKVFDFFLLKFMMDVIFNLHRLEMNWCNGKSKPQLSILLYHNNIGSIQYTHID